MLFLESLSCFHNRVILVHVEKLFIQQYLDVDILSVPLFSSTELHSTPDELNAGSKRDAFRRLLYVL